MYGDKGPMGLLPDHLECLGAETLEKLRLLDAEDLSFEKQSFLARNPHEKVHIKLLERELKRFLSLPLLVADSKLPFAPAIRVDELWHEVILNSPRYRQMCERLYGGYLDHAPNQEELNRKSSGRAVEMAELTNAMLFRFYGPLDQAIWGSELMRPCYPPPPAPAIGTLGRKRNR
ncbi:MAG TPA: hypothetical protein VEA77_00635 [Hyphomicrobium sp.]|nr:hypothetical protein [Hyphomicrobium sp.]